MLKQPLGPAAIRPSKLCQNEFVNFVRQPILMLSDPSRMRPEHYVDEHEFSKGFASMGAMGSSAPMIFKVVGICTHFHVVWFDCVGPGF